MKSCKNSAALVLRLGLAVLFIIAGAGKLFGGLAGFTEALSSVGVPAASAMALIVALIEFFGGIAILIGFLARYFSLVLAVVMVVAVVTMHLSNGFNFMVGGFGMHIPLIGALLALFFLGAGDWSLEKKMLRREL